MKSFKPGLRDMERQRLIDAKRIEIEEYKRKNFPRVLAGGPIAQLKEYAIDDLAEAVKKIALYPNVDILFVDNTYDDGEFTQKLIDKGIPTIHKKPANDDVPTRRRLIDCRNHLRDKALNDGYEYLFSFESDLEPLYPVDLDIISALISNKKLVCSGVYSSLKCSKAPKLCKDCGRAWREDLALCTSCGEKVTSSKDDWQELPMVWTWADPKNKDSDLIRMFNLHMVYREAVDIQKTPLIQVQSTGVGALLIHRSVLKDIKFRYVHGRLSCDDMYFAIDCQAQSPPVPIYADTRVVLKHRYKEWTGKFKSNR